MEKIILASGSPRRKELLEQVGVRFEVIPAVGDEVVQHTNPSEVVEALSSAKAEEIAQRYAQEIWQQDTVIIGADTIVAHDGKILGKPRNHEHAKEMIQQLQGNAHQVYTGVTLILTNAKEHTRKQIVFHEKTEVIVYPMTPQQIAAYVATKEGEDKAGSYAVQGKFAAFIKGIQGDYHNVVGLPIGALMQTLIAEGYPIYESNK